MFDMNWSEFVVIGVVALIVIGPKELPAVLRAIGQWTTKIRRMAGEFQSQFQEAMREAEMADLKKQVDGLGDAAKGVIADFDPLAEEMTKWEPKTSSTASSTAGSTTDSATDSTADSKTEPAADATPDTTPAAVPPETLGVAAPAEPPAAGMPEPSPGQSPAAAALAPDVGSTSEPRPAVSVAEGSGRA
jgi:sec-independent protein translocase protein TatB